MLRSTASLGVITGREGSNSSTLWQSGDEDRDEAGVSGPAG